MSELFVILMVIGLMVCGLLFIPTLQNRKTTGQNSGLIKPILLSLFVLVLSLGLYGVIGSPRIIPKLAEYEGFKQETLTVIRGINEAIKKSPDNPKIYADLAEAYTSIQEFSQAKEALKAAVLLSKGNPDYILALGKAEMSAANGEVNDAAKKAFEMVLIQDKTNISARFYLALGQKQSGDMDAAKKAFEALLGDVPEGIPLRGVIEREMNE